MERRRRFREHGDGDELRVQGQERKEAVIRCKKVPTKARCREDSSLCSNPSVNDGNANRDIGQQNTGPNNDVLCGKQVTARDFMVNIPYATRAAARYHAARTQTHESPSAPPTA